MKFFNLLNPNQMSKVSYCVFLVYQILINYCTYTCTVPRIFQKKFSRSEKNIYIKKSRNYLAHISGCINYFFSLVLRDIFEHNILNYMPTTL